MKSLNFLMLALAVIVVVVAFDHIHMTNAQICNVKTEGIMACKPAVTTPNPTPPTEACCTALSQGDMACLCGYKHSSMLSALGIDPELAMGLPDKCGIQHAPCN